MTVEQLRNNPSYHLLLMLSHDDILPFIQEEFKYGTRTMRAYLLVNLLIMTGMIIAAIMDTGNHLIGWGGIFTWLGSGALLVFTILIPVHEFIHGIAYKLAGAPKVGYGVNWKKFYFYAVADKFVVKRKFFIYIALAPFIVVSVATILTFFFVCVQIKWAMFGVLFVHTGACAGDFALLSFYDRNKHYPEILTFDDTARKQSFFYVSEKGKAQ